MGQFSVEKPGLPGSVLSGNQHRRVRNPRMGRLVQQSPASGAHRLHSAGRSRGTLLRHADQLGHGGVTQTKRPPAKPEPFSRPPQRPLPKPPIPPLSRLLFSEPRHVLIYFEFASISASPCAFSPRLLFSEIIGELKRYIRGNFPVSGRARARLVSGNSYRFSASRTLGVGLAKQVTPHLCSASSMHLRFGLDVGGRSCFRSQKRTARSLTFSLSARPCCVSPALAVIREDPE